MSGDEIYLFGYSRGAFTVRCLPGMICRFGLIPARDLQVLSIENREKLVKQIIKCYRSDKSLEGIHAKIRLSHYKSIGWITVPLSETTSMVNIHYIGVWDTVDSVGVPIRGLRNRLDKLWRKVLKRRL